MRPILLSIAVAVHLASVGPAWADPDKDESGHGRADKDRKEYFKRLEKQQREDHKRYKEQYREDDKRAREAEREYREDIREAEQDRGVLLAQGYRRGYDGYRQSGYRGYTPLSPYPARVAPQPGGYGGYPSQPTDPYGYGADARLDDQPFGRVEDWMSYGQDGYGSYPSPGLRVPYGASPGVPQDSFASPTRGQITALADQLVGQAESYLLEFLPKIGIVPEGERFLTDGTVLRDSAIRFREAALQGAPPANLAAELRNLEASWQRLEARMARVSKGRIGPNIARNLQMGVTIDQISQLMPY